MGVLSFCDAGSAHYLGLPPSWTSVSMRAPLFTDRLVNPVVDPVCIYATVLVVLVAIVVLILVSATCNEVLEYHKDLVIIVKLPLDDLGWPCLAGFKRSHELCTKACWLSEQRRRGVHLLELVIPLQRGPGSAAV